jgi:hypothetical protein
VLKLLVKDVLIGPEMITIRHRIPLRERITTTATTPRAPTRRVNILDIAQCVGGLLSPLLANISLSALDEHFDQQWRQEMDTNEQRRQRKNKGLGNWRIVPLL